MREAEAAANAIHDVKRRLSELRLIVAYLATPLDLDSQTFRAASRLLEDAGATMVSEAELSQEATDVANNVRELAPA